MRARREFGPGSGWLLAFMLILGLLPYWLTIAGAATYCSDGGDDDGICGLVSQGTLAVLLVAVQSPVVIGWVVARRRADSRWFWGLACAALVVNVAVTILTSLWISGDIG